MNRRQILAGVIGMGVESSLHAAARVPTDRGRSVSLIRLMANPNVFDGRELRLAGYLDNNGLDRSVGLYVSESDGRNFITWNSIDVHVDDQTAEKFRGHYVMVEASYRAPSGPGAEYLNGFLEKVSELKLWASGETR